MVHRFDTVETQEMVMSPGEMYGLLTCGRISLKGDTSLMGVINAAARATWRPATCPAPARPPRAELAGSRTDAGGAGERVQPRGTRVLGHGVVMGEPKFAEGSPAQSPHRLRALLRDAQIGRGGSAHTAVPR